MITMTDLIQKIINGDFKDFHLLYTRKSTDEENSQKNSISYQKSENRKYADQHGFSVPLITIEGFCTDGIISERHSGFKESGDFEITEDGKVMFQIERPKFQRLVHYLSKGYFKGVICLCWDRISRNKADDTIIRKLMKQGVDVQFVYAQYDDTSSGQLHMDIDGMFSQHHSRVTSEKVRIATRNARKEGICTYRAPIGYLNQGSMEHKPFDPKRAPIIKRMFELYATGNYTFADLVRYADEQGLTTLPMRRARTKEELLSDDEIILPKVARPIRKTHISKILKNPFYTGKVRGMNGNYVTSVSHEPLISEELFLKVQGFLSKKRVSIYYEKKLDLALRGMVRCTDCKRIYTPYQQKGFTYLRSKCKKDCSNSKNNIRVEQVFDMVKDTLRRLYTNKVDRKKLNATSEQQLQELETKRQKTLLEIAQRKQKAKRELDYLLTEKLSLLTTGTYSPEGFSKERERLCDLLDKCDLETSISEQAMSDTIKDVTIISELLEDLMWYYENADLEKKEQIIRILFSELFTSDMSLSYLLHTEFSILKSIHVSFGDPSGSFSELIQVPNFSRNLKKGIDLIIALLKRLGK